MENNKFKVIISAPYMQSVLDEYRPVFDAHHIELVVPPVVERLNEDELLNFIKDADGIICGDDCITERVLDSAPKLKVISKWGTGIASIDKEAAARRGIPVKNTPNAFTDAVADLTVGFMLSFARNIPWADQDVRAGKWREKRRGVSLSESTLGILGLGNIGRAVARRAQAFGMRIFGHDVVALPAEVLQGTGVEVVLFEQVLRESDFVTLHCDLNPGSKYILSTAQFGMMKQGAYVINTARGPLIDEEALVEALGSGYLGGAALDVFEEEPLPSDSPLRKFSNVLLSPHNANSSRGAWRRVHENTIKNLLDELKVN